MFSPDVERVYALKLVDLTRADEATREGFEQEIRLLQQLRNSARVIDVIDL